MHTERSRTVQHPLTLRAGAVLPELRALVPSLAAGDARIARAVIEDPQRVINLSVQQFAQLAGTAPSTVVRCCQRLGFRGFQHLKIALAHDLGAAGGPRPEASGDAVAPSHVLRRIFASVRRTLDDSLATVDGAAFSEAVGILNSAKKVLFVGVGTSAPLAQDASYRFLTIGVQAYAPPDAHTQHVAARLLGEEDACFAVSHTGATRETVASISSARQAGARTLALTSFSSSPLTEQCDVVLVAGGPEEAFRLEAMTSRVAHLCVLDALFVAVASSQPTRANAALDAYADVISEHRF